MSEENIRISLVKDVNGKCPSYQFRDYKALECQAFVDFIDEECCQRLHECSDVDVYARTLDGVLLDGLDKCAPMFHYVNEYCQVQVVQI